MNNAGRERRPLGQTRGWSAGLAAVAALGLITGWQPETRSQDDTPPDDTRSPEDPAAAGVGPNDATLIPPFQWEDSSPYHRIPKSLLGDLMPKPLTNSGVNRLEFVLTEGFIEFFGLTTEQVDRANQALARMTHDYRILERDHQKPTTEGPRPRFAGGHPEGRQVIREEVFFELTPFRTEAAKLWQPLETDLIQALGETRARLILDSPRLRMSGELKMMSPENPHQPDSATRRVYTYQFEATDPPRVGLHVSQYTENGGGSSGLPFGPARDIYAPNELKPILKKWRDEIAESPTYDELVFGPQAPASQSEINLEANASSGVAWDESSDAFGVPKTALQQVRMPARDLDGKFTQETVALFGLTPGEQREILTLYDQVIANARTLEEAHFEVVDADKHTYVIRAYPEKREALVESWRNGLREVVGDQRAELLQKAFATPMDPMAFFRQHGQRPERRPMMPSEIQPDWLARGTVDINIAVSMMDNGRGGTTYRVTYNGDEGQPASSSGPLEHLPIRLRPYLQPIYSKDKPSAL